MTGPENFNFEDVLRRSEMPTGLRSLTDEELDFWISLCAAHAEDAHVAYKAAKGRQHWNHKRREALDEQERRAS